MRCASLPSKPFYYETKLYSNMTYSKVTLISRHAYVQACAPPPPHCTTMIMRIFCVKYPAPRRYVRQHVQPHRAGPSHSKGLFSKRLYLFYHIKCYSLLLTPFFLSSSCSPFLPLVFFLLITFSTLTPSVFYPFRPFPSLPCS